MVVVLLALIWVVCFMSFTVVSVLAFGSGNTFEYKLFGVQFPYAAVALLVGMATSSGLLWSNYRDEDFRSAEQLIIWRVVRYICVWFDSGCAAGDTRLIP